VTTPGSTSDPLAALIAAIEAVATAGDLEPALEGVLGAAASLRPAMAAILFQDPDRPGLQVAAASGFDDAARAQLAIDAGDPAHPFAEAATTRRPVFDREATMADGSAFVGAYLPLVVVSGGVEVALGSLGLGWPVPRALDQSDRRLLEALAALAAIAVDRARLSSTAAERSDWFERMAHTDPLTGLAAVNRSGDVAIAMRDLAPTSGNAVYEAWVIGGDGVPVPLGGFTVDNSRTAFFESSGLPSAEGIVLALTLESGPGATTPTMPIISKGVAAAPG